MNILIACEYSGIVRDAFKNKGHFAVSCDLLSSDIKGYHYQGNVLDTLTDGWDMMIAFPPCTYLSYAGNRWLKQEGRQQKINEALEFFKLILNAPIPKIAVENPRGWANKYIREPEQIFHPYHFGEPYSKATCLWLKNLPLLNYTNVLTNYFHNWTKYKKGSHNGHSRSKTFQGVADAMAAQWG